MNPRIPNTELAPIARAHRWDFSIRRDGVKLGPLSACWYNWDGWHFEVFWCCWTPLIRWGRIYRKAYEDWEA